MPTPKQSQAEVEERLWSEIKDARFGMLGLMAGAATQHFQPMTAFPERHDGLLWFFARKDSDIARAAANGAKAMFIVQAKDQDFQACVGGLLSEAYDRERIGKFWNPIVAAWYPHGKDDPNLTLLRLAASDAQAWISEAGPLRFAFEIAKANLTGHDPNLGGQMHLRLDEGRPH